MAYPREAEPPIAGTGACPASHPVAIPEISYNFAIYVTAETGPPPRWRLSSDGPDIAAPGVSLHADLMNGWDENTMHKIVENCLRPARACGVGLPGDGTRLSPVVQDWGRARAVTCMKHCCPALIFGVPDRSGRSKDEAMVGGCLDRSSRLDRTMHHLGRTAASPGRRGDR